MTALPVPRSTDLQLPTRRDERLVLYVAAGAAFLLHLAALFLPLPARRNATPPGRPPHEPPRITRPVLAPPPLPETSPPRVPRTRRVPVPFELEPDDDPVHEPDPSIVEESDALPRIAVPPSDADPPPGPAVVDEHEEGLVAPVALPGHEAPHYPAMSVRVRQQGRVILSAVITERGRVASIEVVSAPQPELGMSRAAIEAVRRWEYTPGTLHGRPVAVRLTVIVDFELN